MMTDASGTNGYALAYNVAAVGKLQSIEVVFDDTFADTVKISIGYSMSRESWQFVVKHSEEKREEDDCD